MKYYYNGVYEGYEYRTRRGKIKFKKVSIWIRAYRAIKAAINAMHT